MFNAHPYYVSTQNDHIHHIQNYNYVTLNPDAPEFHPFYTFTPPNYNDSTIITTNFHIYPHYYYNNLNYNNDNYPHTLPPPLVQLPYHHHFPHHTENFQEYPSYHFIPNNTTNDTYYLQNYQNALPNPNDATMQPHLPHHARIARVHGPELIRTRPKRRYFRDDRQAGPVVRRVDRGSGNHGNKMMKGGYISNSNNSYDEARVRVRVRARVRCRGKMGKKEVMAVKCDGSQTTAMIRNVPNQYTRAMLVKFLDEFCNKENKKLKDDIDDDHPPLAYDFLYLPIDFKRCANKGYAFVNFTHPTAVWKLHLACTDRGWAHCSSPKVCQIAYASIQGKEKLVDHFGRSRFNCNQEEYLPICFNPARDGSGIPVNSTTIGELVSFSR